MPQAKYQNLGTIFTGKVDATFENAIKRLQSVMGQTVTGMTRATTAQKKATTATTQHTKAQKGLQKGLTVTKGQLTQVSGALERMKRAFKIILSFGVAGSVMFGLINALRSAVEEIINFDQALKNLQAITGATDAQISGMKDRLIEIASVTKFSTTELAEGMVLLGQAGFSASEAINAIGATADLATGTLSSMQYTADLLTTSVRAFGLSSVEATRVADVMANAINKSKLTIDKLRISFNFVGAAAAQTGLSLEETAAAMMVLANNGLRASTIGTGLRQVLSRMMAPNRKLRNAFESVGIELDKINPRLVGFQQSLRILTPLIWDHKKGVVDMGKAYSLFGLRGAQAVAILAREMAPGGTYDEMLNKTYEVGTAAAMAAKQAEGLGVKFKNLADRAKILAIAIGDAGFTGALRVLVDALRLVTKSMGWFIATTIGSAITQFVLLTATTYGLVKAFRALWTSVGVSLFAKLSNSIFNIGIQMGIARMASGSLISAFKTMGLVISKLGLSLAIGGFISVGLALKKWSSKADDHIKKLKEERVEIDRTISSVDVYRGAILKLGEKLGVTAGKSREYRALLTRLKTDHPELVKEVDLTTISYRKLADELDRFLVRKESERIDNVIKTMAGLSDKAVKLQRKLKDDFVYDWTYGWGKAGEITSMVINDISDQASIVLGHYAQLVHSDTMTLAGAQAAMAERLRLLGVNKQYINQIYYQLPAAVEKEKEAVKEMIMEVKSRIEQLGPVVAEVFKGLKPGQFIYFVDKLRQLESDIAKVRKRGPIWFSEDDVRIGKEILILKQKFAKDFWPEIDKKAGLDAEQKKRLREETERKKREAANWKAMFKERGVLEKEEDKKRLEERKKFQELLKEEEEREIRHWRRQLELRVDDLVRSGATELEISRFIAEQKMEHADGLWDGLKKGWEFSLLNFETWGERAVRISQEVAKQMHQAFSDFFFDLIKLKFENLSDTIVNFLESIYDAMIRGWSDMLARILVREGGGWAKNIGSMLQSGVGAMMGGAGGGTSHLPTPAVVSHGGGLAGLAKVFRNSIPVAHAGVYNGPDEVMAVLRKNETVLTPAQMRAMQKQPSVTVNIDNETGMSMEAEQVGEVKWDFDQAVIDVILKRRTQSLSFRRAMGTR